MKFQTISITIGSGGIAPSYERFSVSRDELAPDDIKFVDELLLESDFANIETSPLTKAMRDVALSSIRVVYSDGAEKVFKYFGELDGPLDKLVKFVSRLAMES